MIPLDSCLLQLNHERLPRPVWIEDEHVKALEEVKKVHGTPVSESIRRALTEYFAKKRV